LCLEILMEGKMKVAISTDSDRVALHFGRCPQYTIVDIEDGKVKNTEVIDNPGHAPGFIPRFLKDLGVTCVICGGIGQKAIDNFNNYGIKVISGVIGNVKDIIKQFIDGSLKGGASLCEKSSAPR